MADYGDNEETETASDNESEEDLNNESGYITTRDGKVIPMRKKAGYEQYITTKQLNPDEGYPTTPALTNEDYFPNANQSIQIGTSPSAGYSQGAYPIFSGNGNLFPINTYTKRARALEDAAYQNQVAKIRREQQANAEFKNLFTTPDYKDPFYSQQLYNVSNDFAQRMKDKFYALGGSYQEALRIMNNPQTPQEHEAAREWYTGVGQLKSMNNVVNYLANTDAEIRKQKESGNIVLPETEKLLSDYHQGKIDIGNPNYEIGLHKLETTKKVNEELNAMTNAIKSDVTESEAGKRTFKKKEDVQKYVEAQISGDLNRWAVGAGLYESGKTPDKQKVVDYYTDVVSKALPKKWELNQESKEAKKKEWVVSGNTYSNDKNIWTLDRYSDGTIETTMSHTDPKDNLPISFADHAEASRTKENPTGTFNDITGIPVKTVRKDGAPPELFVRVSKDVYTPIEDEEGNTYKDASGNPKIFKAKEGEIIKLPYDVFASKIQNEYGTNPMALEQIIKGKTGVESNTSGKPSAKTVSKKQYSASANKTKLIYADGTEEIVDGKQ